MRPALLIHAMIDRLENDPIFLKSSARAIVQLFARSPFGALQEHMTKSAETVDLLDVVGDRGDRQRIHERLEIDRAIRVDA